MLNLQFDLILFWIQILYTLLSLSGVWNPASLFLVQLGQARSIEHRKVVENILTLTLQGEYYLFISTTWHIHMHNISIHSAYVNNLNGHMVCHANIEDMHCVLSLDLSW